MADRYWVGGTGNWSDTAHWSATSGGAGGVSVPTSSDNAIFNGSSGTGTATVDTGATRECLSLTTTAYTGTLTVSQRLDIYGDMTLASGMTLSGSQPMRMSATSGSKTITTNGKTIPNSLDIGNSTSTATFTLQDNLTCSNEVRMLYGTFDANDKTVTCAAIRDVVDSSVQTATLMMGNGTWTLNGTAAAIYNFDATCAVQKEDSNIIVSDTSSNAKTYELGGYSWPEMTLPTSTAVHTFYDGGNIDGLTLPAGTQVKFESGSTFGIGSITSSGTIDSKVSIGSSSNGSQHFLTPLLGQDIEADYLTIQDSSANADSVNWFAGDFSTDNGNNSGWIFHTTDTFIAVSSKRNVAANLLVSWKKDFRSNIRFFTIGVSTIGGNDPIKSEGGIPSDWNKYLYTDESDYILSLDWERQLNMPVGGVSKALADGRLSNTSGRFLPEHVGGNGDLFTAILPRRPFIINAGFEYNEVPQLIPEFVGIFTKQPLVNLKDRYLDFHGADFIDFLQNRKIDNTVMFTGVRSDEIIERFLTDMGFGTAQFDLDVGINNIPFAIFERGERFADAVNDLVQAENGHFYQDAQGTLRFENRQHWDSSPHNTVSYVISTAQVIDAEAPDEDHIINVVEVKAKVRNKQPEQTIFKLIVTDAIEITAGGTKELFVDFEDPALSVTTPTSSGTLSYFKANTLADGTGTDVSSSVSITYAVTFAKSAKFIFTNSTGAAAYLTELVVSGRPSKIEREIYIRDKDDSSVTAYEERPYVIENDYIQSEDWGRSFAQMILQDYAEPEKLQRITIRAIAELELGDLISWQGRYWRVFNIRNILNPSVGFTQELLLLQRTIQSYFRIGISTVGGSDRIAP